jgi:hypothetical protein
MKPRCSGDNDDNIKTPPVFITNCEDKSGIVDQGNSQ